MKKKTFMRSVEMTAGLFQQPIDVNATGNNT